jgi:hypothetical protein
MKKLITFFCFALFLISLISCEKEELIAVQDENSSKEISIPAKSASVSTSGNERPSGEISIPAK